MAESKVSILIEKPTVNTTDGRFTIEIILHAWLAQKENVHCLAVRMCFSHRNITTIMIKMRL